MDEMKEMLEMLAVDGAMVTVTKGTQRFEGTVMFPEDPFGPNQFGVVDPATDKARFFNWAKLDTGELALDW